MKIILSGENSIVQEKKSRRTYTNGYAECVLMIEREKIMECNRLPKNNSFICNQFIFNKSATAIQLEKEYF